MSDALIMRRGGSGGGEVKFIFASQRPTSAEENSVFIQTATAPESWVFSMTQPTAAEGLMWVQVSNVSNGEFNAFEDNTLMVYPVACRLYTDGAWKNLTAATWRNGKWNNWAVYLMKAGEATTQGAGLTTGIAPWINSSTFYGSGTVSSATGCFVMTAPVTFNALGILCSTKSTIDLTSYNYLEMKVKSVSSSGESPRAIFYLMVCSTRSGAGQYDSCVAKKEAYVENMKAGQLFTVDLSAIKGEYYVSIGICHWGNTTARGGEVSIEDIYLY